MWKGIFVIAKFVIVDDKIAEWYCLVSFHIAEEFTFFSEMTFEVEKGQVNVGPPQRRQQLNERRKSSNNRCTVSWGTLIKILGYFLSERFVEDKSDTNR